MVERQTGVRKRALGEGDVFPSIRGESAEDRAKKFNAYDFLSSYWVRERLQEDFGFALHELELHEQGAFLDVLSQQREGGEVERLQTFTHTFGVEGARAFLVARYGENYGETLLTLGSEYPHVLKDFLPAFNAVHMHAYGVQELLGGVEELVALVQEYPAMATLGPQLYEGVIRRAKDTLLVLEKLCEQSESVVVPYYGDAVVSVSEVAKVLQALQSYGETLAFVEQVAGDGEATLQPLGVERAGAIVTYHFVREPHTESASPYFSIQVRPRGAPLGAYDGTREFDGEARINILMHHSPIATSLSEPSRQEAVSLRLDCEGKTRRGGEIVENDPTRKEGELSLEIGSVFGEDQSLPGNVVGRVMAVGNYLGLQHAGSAHEVQYYHNRESFDPALGDADGFANLVQAVQHLIERKYYASL